MRLIVIPFLLLTAIESQAEIYKWTDEHGRTYYGDRPGAEITETIEYQSRIAKPSRQADSWQDIQKKQRKFLNYLEEERQSRKDQHQQRQAIITAQKRQCEEAKTFRQELISTPLFYREDDKGNKEYVSQDEIDENLKKTEKFIQQNCQL